MIPKSVVLLPAIVLSCATHAAVCPNPSCRSEVSDSAKCCKFCGRELQTAPSPAPRPASPTPRPTYQPPKPTYTSQPQYSYTPSRVSGWTPIRIGIAGTGGIPPGKWDVYGLNLSLLAGESNSAFGISAGSIADTGNVLAGISGGMFSVFKEVYGIQGAAMFNHATQKFRGIQIGFANNAPTDSIGVQIGVFNTIGTGTSSLTLPILNMRF